MEAKGVTNLSNMIGHNFRLGEVECAIGVEQLKKLSSLVESRQALASALTEGLQGMPGLKTPVTKEDRTHTFYVYAMQVDTAVLGVSRDRLCKALQAEGLWVNGRYQNIHLLPVYQKKIAYGSGGFPWSSNLCRRQVNYSKGICPVAERMQDDSYIGLGMCIHELGLSQIPLLVAAFRKVWSALPDLGRQ